MTDRIERSELAVPARGTGERFTGTVAVGIGLVSLLFGVWAFVHPTSFYETVARFEPYNAHLIRDIGAFQIGLGTVLLLAVKVRDALLVALAGVGASAVFHLLSHVVDVDEGGQPLLEIPAFVIVAVLLLAAAAVRARSLRR